MACSWSLAVSSTRCAAQSRCSARWRSEMPMCRPIAASSSAWGSAALASLGRNEDAKAVVERLVELQAGITCGTAILQTRYAKPEHRVALENALRRAGLPKGGPRRVDSPAIL